MTFEPGKVTIMATSDLRSMNNKLQNIVEPVMPCNSKESKSPKESKYSEVGVIGAATPLEESKALRAIELKPQGLGSEDSLVEEKKTRKRRVVHNRREYKSKLSGLTKEEKRQYHRDYHKQWREKNKTRLYETINRWRSENRKQYNEYMRDYNANKQSIRKEKLGETELKISAPKLNRSS